MAAHEVTKTLARPESGPASFRTHISGAGSGHDGNGIRVSRLENGDKVKADGISLLAEVLGSANDIETSAREMASERTEVVSAVNGGHPRPVGKFSGEVDSSLSETSRLGDGTRDREEAEGKKENGKTVGEYNREGEDDDVGEELANEGEYSVGDFVWGKIKSHPWWPGRIYEPLDASQLATKYKQRSGLLVAYFGDGSFSWCFPSKLIPFLENFEEMSKQSSAKTFVNAVQSAVDEIGRLVELEMTCSCIPQENRLGLTRPVAVNAGIKQGVLVPEGGTGGLSILRCEPADLLANVRLLGHGVSVPSMLELVLLKSWLSAFYRAKGAYPLIAYHDPVQIEGLEDNTTAVDIETNDFSVPIEVPIQGPSEEDWLSSPTAHHGKDQGFNEDKIYQRRKEKSVAEIMADDSAIKSEGRKRSVKKDEEHSGKLPHGKKRKGDDGNEKDNGNLQASSTGRKKGRKKKTENSVSPKITDSRVTSVEKNGIRHEEEANEFPESRGLKNDEVAGAETKEDRDDEESEKNSMSREKRKSKYLLPPYTNVRWRAGNSDSKKEAVMESEKITNIMRLGERMTKVAGELIVSSPISRCTSETVQKESESHEVDKSLPTETRSQKMEIDPVVVRSSVHEVLSEVQSTARDPRHPSKNESFDMIKGFISIFRSSIYRDGPNYKAYHKMESDKKRRATDSEPATQKVSGRKRKATDSEPAKQKVLDKKRKAKGYEPGNTEGASIQANLESPELLLHRTRNNKTEQVKSGTPKHKKGTKASSEEMNDKKVQRKSPPLSLIVTFSPGFTMPSKDDTVRIFSKFGDVNEKETDIKYNSHCIQVVYSSTSDAEEAFRELVKQSPFGAADVNFKLKYSSAASKTRSGQRISSSSKRTEDHLVAAKQAGEEVSELGVTREKLQLMSVTLDKLDGKISLEEKSELVGYVKILLEKVHKINAKASK